MRKNTTVLTLCGLFILADILALRQTLEMRGDVELITRGLDGSPQRIMLPVVDKERAELEAFADAVVAKQAYMVPPDQAVNGIAVIEAIVASEESGNPIKIK